MKFRRGALGGTFSLLHEGHKHLIRRALEYAERLVIGVSSSELVEKLGKSHPVEDLAERIERLKDFLARERLLHRCEVVAIDDRAGPAASDPELDCLIATDETLTAALEVNLLRISRGLPPLSLIVVEPLLDSDGTPVSSTKLWRRLKGSSTAEHAAPNSLALAEYRVSGGMRSRDTPASKRERKSSAVGFSGRGLEVDSS